MNDKRRNLEINQFGRKLDKDDEEGSPLLHQQKSSYAQKKKRKTFWLKPRFDYPRIKLEFIEAGGYLFGNRNGRSGYNIILEGLFSFLFMLTLFFLLQNFHKISVIEKTTSHYWDLLFVFPLLKNLLLFYDFYLLKKANKYSWLSLLVLISNTFVWSFSLTAFRENKKIIFSDVVFSEKILNKFSGVYRVILIDNYIQFILLFVFMVQVYNKSRVVDFYRDYYNPWNFCFSCSVNAILFALMSNTKSPLLWNFNFGLGFFIGCYFVFLYFAILYKLILIDMVGRLKILSKF